MKRIRLIHERKKRGLTQKEVARVLNLSEVYVRKLEKGDSEPGRKTLLKFEKIYGVRDRELFPDIF
ncbi:helix-turn-helix domain-containing protein [Bacillus thuringiensis]